MHIKEHYENHLANFYSWMFGDFNTKIKEKQQFFQYHKIKPASSKIAIDLGAGCGFQSVPLAKIGFEVKEYEPSPKVQKYFSAFPRGLLINVTFSLSAT